MKKIANKSHHGPLHDIDLQEQEEDSQQQNPLTKPTATHLNKGTSVTISPNGVGLGEQRNRSKQATTTEQTNETNQTQAHNNKWTLQNWM